MKKILLLLIVFFPQLLLSKSVDSKIKIICQLKDPKKEIIIDLNNRVDLNSAKALKADFLYNKINFGYCLFEIKSNNESGTQQSEYNSIYFEKNKCIFESKKQSSDLEVTETGKILYNKKINALLDIFGEKYPIKCSFEK